jgi:hypothetical protein
MLTYSKRIYDNPEHFLDDDPNLRYALREFIIDNRKCVPTFAEIEITDSSLLLGLIKLIPDYGKKDFRCFHNVGKPFFFPFDTLLADIDDGIIFGLETNMHRIIIRINGILEINRSENGKCVIVMPYAKNAGDFFHDKKWNDLAYKISFPNDIIGASKEFANRKANR